MFSKRRTRILTLMALGGITVSVVEQDQSVLLIHLSFLIIGRVTNPFCLLGCEKGLGHLKHFDWRRGGIDQSLGAWAKFVRRPASWLIKQ